MAASIDGAARIQPAAWRRLVRLWPIILFLGYLGATILLFAFGPIPFPVTNPWATYGFLAAAHVALLGGYLAAPFRPMHRRPSAADHWMFSAPKLVMVSSLLNIAVLIPATLFMTEGSLDLIGALRDPGTAYRHAYQMSVNTTNPWSYVQMLVAPLLVLTMPLTFYYWRELSAGLRCLAVTAIAVGWAAGAILGRYKSTADLLLIGFVFVLVHVFRRPRPPSARACAAIVGIAIVLLGVFFGLFANTIGGRPWAVDIGNVTIINARVDFDNRLMRAVPEPLHPSFILLCRYLTQGYYGLSLALRLDFVWTYGLGNSFFLHLAEERFLGTEYARQHAYPARIEEEFGYLMLSRWHSIYPWLASDLTFAGTVVFVGLVGMLLAITWGETLSGDNPFSVSLFANLCLMLFYFNANNQVLAFPVAFSASVGTIAIWVYTRRRLRLADEAVGAPAWGARDP